MSAQDLLLVGCGKMGGALLSRITPDKFPRVVVVDPNTPTCSKHPNIITVRTPTEIPSNLDPAIVILAIKPQTIQQALPFYSKYPSTVFLSIAAGVTLKTLAATLTLPKAAIVRSMPNLPASIGLGATAAVQNAHVTPQQRAICRDILDLFGLVAWLDTESHLDAVTALSGSGPAYIFALCEAMAEAGIQLGLPRPLSESLARQTVVGSAAMLAQCSDPPQHLRETVTSPNGTTAAALRILLENNALTKLMTESMTAAAQRSRELGTPQT